MRPTDVYEIPYRSLVPLQVDGLPSATHEPAGAVRVLPPVFAIGQAAGDAGAPATQRGVAHRVDVSGLQHVLRRQGAILA